MCCMFWTPDKKVLAKVSGCKWLFVSIPHLVLMCLIFSRQRDIGSKILNFSYSTCTQLSVVSVWLSIQHCLLVCGLQSTWTTCTRSTTASCSYTDLKFRRFQLENVRLLFYHYILLGPALWVSTAEMAVGLSCQLPSACTVILSKKKQNNSDVRDI